MTEVGKDVYVGIGDYVRGSLLIRAMTSVLLALVLYATRTPELAGLVLVTTCAALLFELQIYRRHAHRAENPACRAWMHLGTAVVALSFSLPTFFIAGSVTVSSGYAAATYASAALIIQVTGYARNRMLALVSTLPHGLGLVSAGTVLGLHYLSLGETLLGAVLIIVGPVYCWMIVHLYQELDARDRSLRSAVAAAKARSREAQAHRLEAEAANIAKTNFLASMSHEVRTPMNGILGLADMLGRTSKDAETRRLGRIIHESADSLLVILNDVLDFSKLEAGRIELDPHPFDLRAMVDSVASLIGSRIDPDAVALSACVADAVPAQLVADETRLRQILLNLAGNAAKFTARGRIDINVEQLAAPDADGRVGLRLSVSDTGIGIAEGDIGRMFERFSQASSGTTRDYGGTGLGLSICRELAQLMGAHIGAVSQPGVGSCFYLDIALPVALSDGKADTPSAPSLDGMTAPAQALG
ncbi:MAG: ATP-binding protein [Litorimonas sp.]